MNIHEYQAKAVLKDYGVPVPEGGVAFTPDEAVKAAEALSITLTRRGRKSPAVRRRKS